ncbi:protein CYSTEINE-RICH TRANSMEMBRANE MODULE 1 isoform X2 [Arachis duranensis]|uniref:Protein CYSTEINE-RICH TRANSMEMBRANE MODULE 1 isoform X2 n=1 Tax=Arachis duranensis TaxID=130453 RepID=A0A6P4B533_ARADU|nr:protein CYSTEINE-RICH TRANSMEMBRANE MODULE 1 isoform X2 [Arachis duranensis]XP_016169211.1 cysteine-rich and transmembrane domain-containing protein A isoform X2 [Arachis ipaensis]XP_025610603.1 cysteine-rich and transmembrane domain-containing protein WIH2 [Arachis hypogaea]XP_025672923.1 cysteine-rich and transmembrane domain-containing protein WIH2 isoform X2 [Arachis hypogaea]XP_057726057.1 protein CYSTEINE-RICH TRANSMEMBRANE MODULE 1-like isoform X2 [Arachis stenosperma]QHN96826.1 unch
MSHFNNQHEAPVSYPPTMSAYPPPPAASYVSAPPPMGYPSKDGPPAAGYPQQSVPQHTTTKGDGFWKGCCAALCCCCALDICF